MWRAVATDYGYFRAYVDRTQKARTRPGRVTLRHGRRSSGQLYFSSLHHGRPGYLQ